jgi:hypothetical protein
MKDIRSTGMAEGKEALGEVVSRDNSMRDVEVE